MKIAYEHVISCFNIYVLSNSLTCVYTSWILD